MSFQLEYDSSSHVQEHLNELTARVTLTLFLASVATLVWITQVDVLLDKLLNQLNPCQGDCLNLFDPAKWSAVRWMTAALLGIITVMPIALHQMWKFSKPGLLPSERTWMKTWFLAGALSTFLAVFSTIGILFPMIFDTGHQTHEAMKLDARYDAVHMLSIVIAVIWTEVIVACAIFAMMLAGILGMLNEDTADWWRIRIYGLVLLLLLASLPEFGGLAFTLSALAIGTIEVCSRKWLKGNAPLFEGFQPVMDSEGALRKMILVDCSSDDAETALFKAVKSPIPVYSAGSLCTSLKERESLIEKVIRYRLSDVFLSGCSIEDLPDSFKTNCHSLGCTLRELDLDRTQAHRVLPSLHRSTEIELSLASINDPWPQSKIHERIISILESSDIEQLVIDTRNKENSASIQLTENQVILRLKKKLAVEVQTKLESNGFNSIVM